MTTGAWTESDLADFEREDELELAPRRADGSLAKPRIVWAVRVGGAVYVRSVNGAEGAWYRTVRKSHAGHVTIGSVNRDVRFADVAGPDGPSGDAELEDRIDSAYRTKYARYTGPVASITGAKARATTLRVLPQ